MGGNGAYIPSERGVPMSKRTHRDTNYRIDGHKVLVQAQNPIQAKIPMNSNSENPIYLCGKIGENGKIIITTIGIYEKHRLVMTIDIKFDKNGDIIPYAERGKGTTHAHLWPEDKYSGNVGRRSHDYKNILPYGREYNDLLEKVSEFNKKGKVWKR